MTVAHYLKGTYQKLSKNHEVRRGVNFIPNQLWIRENIVKVTNFPKNILQTFHLAILKQN